jgi:hypothetical protein
MPRREQARTGVERLCWTRWEAYQFHTDGWVYQAGPVVQEYDPTRETSLPSELARVRLRLLEESRRLAGRLPFEAIHPPIAEFLQQWGLLGLTTLQGPRNVELDGRKRLAHGDHWVWFQNHAENVERCLQLAFALQQGDPEALALLMSRLETRPHRIESVSQNRSTFVPGNNARPLPLPTLASSTYTTFTASSLYDPDTAIDTKAEAIFAKCLAANMGQTDLRYDRETTQGVHQFRTLIEYIYWQLAQARKAGTRLRQCHACQTIFVAHDDRQAFCPPPAGITKSRCARRDSYAKVARVRPPKPKGRPRGQTRQ